MKNSHILLKILWVVGAVFVAGLLVTAGAVWSFSRGNAGLSRALFQVAAPVSWVFSRGTGRLVSSLEVWNEGVWLGKEAGRVWQAQDAKQSSSNSFAVLSELSPQTSRHLSDFARNFERSWLLSRLVGDHTILAEGLSLASGAVELLQQSQETDARFLVLLQNTDEVRATGGFLGSYTVLDFSQNEPWNGEVRDMYDPSGVSVSLPSPPGQEEYLSEGRGMRLIDANWNPDFPLTAQVILEYFRQIRGDAQEYEGVIAVPLTAIEALVEALGGVYVPDQQQTLTAETFAEMLRADRGQFFAGSQQKAHALQSVSAALFVRLNELSPEEWGHIARSLLDAGVLHEIQVYSAQPQLQDTLNSLGLTGAVQPPAGELFVFPVESNVGINKANRGVSRSLFARFQPGTLEVSVQFRNTFTVADRPMPSTDPAHHQADHLGYANYYRLLVSPEMELERVEINGSPLFSWDDDLVRTGDGTWVRQYGFLITVPEESATQVVVRFLVPNALQPKITLKKQVGISYNSVMLSCFDGLSTAISLDAPSRTYQAVCAEAIQ